MILNFCDKNQSHTLSITPEYLLRHRIYSTLSDKAPGTVLNLTFPHPHSQKVSDGGIYERTGRLHLRPDRGKPVEVWSFYSPNVHKIIVH